MAAEFIGFPAPHVPQPDGTELCFAAISSSMTGASVDEADRALAAAGLYNERDEIMPMGETSLELPGSVMAIEPVKNPFDGIEDTKAVLGLLDEQFVAGRAVAILYKKYRDTENNQYHWTLLTGYTLANGVKGGIRVMDPLRNRHLLMKRAQIADMIERSNRDLGFYAYALSVSQED